MAEQLYTIIQSQNTKEYHIFETYLNNDNVCTHKNNNYSICNKMEYEDNDKIFSKCKNEQTTRLKAAEKGRSVCGICISTFYTTPE